MNLVFAVVPIDRIFNWMAPENVTAWNSFPSNMKKRWWDNDVVEKRMCFSKTWIDEFDKITKHFTNLETSIAKEGFRNPISCVTGPIRDVRCNDIIENDNKVPTKYQEDQTNLIYTHPFGGSRILVAQKLGIETVPCVIHDFSELFIDHEKINSTNFRKWFDNEYFFANQPPYIRSKNMTNTIRNSQKIAISRAKEKVNV